MCTGVQELSPGPLPGHTLMLEKLALAFGRAEGNYVWWPADKFRTGSCG